MGPSPFVSFQEGLQDMTLAGAFVARLARSRSASLRSILAPAFPLPPLKLSQSSSPLFFPVDDDACLVRRKSWLAVVHLLVACVEGKARKAKGYALNSPKSCTVCTRPGLRCCLTTSHSCTEGRFQRTGGQGSVT